MDVFLDKGIHIREGIREIVLDPNKPTRGAIVSHGHLDHLIPGALMTPETLEVMKVRTGLEEGTVLSYGKKREFNGFSISFREAGHVFGSAMVRIGDTLYTGDLNPEGGLTCGRAKTERCDILIIESTYGKREYCFPPKKQVQEDLLSWVEIQLEENPVAIGSYEFGKAQELIALMNNLDCDVVVTKAIADIADIYRAHGIRLKYKRFEDLTPEEKKEPHVFIVSRHMLKRPVSDEIKEFKVRGGKSCYVSGWCAIFNYTGSYDIDAQFPFSDHGDFDALMEFVSGCSPEVVYTCHGHPRELAAEIRDTLGIRAECVKKS
ncbi:MAG: MBL fold metallo-hydrolase RNA specificity domain-containing protein [Thermoplasmata archaeon]